MSKTLKNIKKIFILSLLLISLFFTFFPQTNAQDLWNAFVSIDLTWANGHPEDPIVPRDEIYEMSLKLIITIDTGATFGAGLYEGYEGSTILIDLKIVEYSSWCSVTLERDLLQTNLSRRVEAITKLYIHIDENAPAFETGIIKFNVLVRDLGLIKGDNKTFDLTFKPAFSPIIKSELPELNTKRIDPTSKVTFPIEIENVGNAEQRVFFKILNVPDDWSAVITPSVDLGKDVGSKNTAYLTIIPSHSFGYHYDEAIIIVEILPTFVNNINITGKPIYANFIIKSRGFSSVGIEFYLPIGIVIFLIIFFGYRFFKKMPRKKKSSS